MKTNYIRNILSFAIVLLIVLIITQISWVRKAYLISQDKFSYDVEQVLLISLGHFRSINGDDRSCTLYPVKRELLNKYTAKSDYISDPYLLLSILKLGFERALIQEDFILSIYEPDSKSVVHYKSFTFDGKILKHTESELEWSKLDGYYYSIYFPDFNNILYYHMGFWIYSSIIVIIIIGFFSFIIHQLLKQRRVNLMKNNFISNMTHEFKTPISTISISAEALNRVDVLDNEDKLTKYIQIIQSENLRLQSQVERILKYATIEKERAHVKLTPISVNELIRFVVSNFRMNIESKDGSITTDLVAFDDIIMGNEEYLNNIFGNLIDNAIKYSPEILQISIRSFNRKGLLEIVISDLGVGISKPNQGFVFEKFYRVPTGNLHNVKGFGIGLSYVQSLVHKQNGNISLKSALGKGSSFILTFKSISL